MTTLKQGLRSAGLDMNHFSGHSLRIGAATSAAAAGVPDHLIKILGRWQSEAYQLYIPALYTGSQDWTASPKSS